MRQRLRHETSLCLDYVRALTMARNCCCVSPAFSLHTMSHKSYLISSALTTHEDPIARKLKKSIYFSVMADLEKVNKLLDEVKLCADPDINKYWPQVCTIFIPMATAGSKECARSFYQWAEENVPRDSLKFYYAELLLATSYFMNDDHETALPMVSGLRKSFGEYDDQDGIEICSLLTGVIYRSMGNFDLALNTLIPVFDYFKRNRRYPIFFEGSCNSLGNVNFELHNYDEAYSIFNAGYKASLESGNHYFNIYALHGMGKIKMRLNQPVETLEYFNKALEVAETIEAPLHIGNSWSELANFYLHIGNLEAAEKLNKQALAIREQNNFTGAVVTSYINLGEIYIRQSRWEEAIDVLNKGLELAEKIKLKPKIYQVHLLLSKVYKAMNETAISLHHYEIFHEIREKVLEEDNARKLADAKLIFEAEQTRKENIIIKRQKEEIQRKNIELQETIDELTITRISRKAKALTLIIAIVMFIVEDTILHFTLHLVGEQGYFISLIVKMVIIFSLSPINKGIEHALVKKVIKRRKITLPGVDPA